MEGLFAPGSLDDIRAISRATMTETVQISRGAGTTGGGIGDAVEPTDAMGNPLPGPQEPLDADSAMSGTMTVGRIAGGPKTEQERAIAGKLDNPDLVMVALPLGTDVQEEDRITIRGVALEVVWVPDPQPTNLIDLRVMAQREA
jgi:hypothetical protein